MANNTARPSSIEAEINDIARRILGIESLHPPVDWGKPTPPQGPVPYGAIEQALYAAFEAGQRAAATPAPEASKSGPIEVGETVILPYNSVNYTALVLRLNSKTAKIRILAMDTPPTLKGIKVGEELSCSKGALERPR